MSAFRDMRKHLNVYLIMKCSCSSTAYFPVSISLIENSWLLATEGAVSNFLYGIHMGLPSAVL